MKKKGYALENLRYEIALYADPLPDHVNFLPYEKFEIVSVEEIVRNDNDNGLVVVIANKGPMATTATLNFLFFDEKGIPIHGGTLYVNSDIEIGADISPGSTGTASLFMPPDTADYELFVSAWKNTD